MCRGWLTPPPPPCWRQVDLLFYLFSDQAHDSLNIKCARLPSGRQRLQLRVGRGLVWQPRALPLPPPQQALKPFFSAGTFGR